MPFGSPNRAACLYLKKRSRCIRLKKIYVVDRGFGIVKTGDAYGRRVMTEEQVRNYLQNEDARYKGMSSLMDQELRNLRRKRASTWEKKFGDQDPTLTFVFIQ